MSAFNFTAKLDKWRLRRDGVVRLRQCYDRQAIAQIRSEAKKIFEARKNEIASLQPLDTSEQRLRLRQLSTISLDVLAKHTGPIEPILVTTRIASLATGYLGKRPEPHENSFVRRLVPGNDIQSLPFHQDQTILKTRLLNVWVPLDPCGTNAPGLETVVTSARRLIEVSGDSTDRIPVERVKLNSDKVVEEHGHRSLWHPVLEPGDVLLFLGTTIHRTYVTPQMTKSRMSVELRLV